MSKKRKTKKEKIISSLRKKIDRGSALNSQNVPVLIPTDNEAQKKNRNIQNDTSAKTSAYSESLISIKDIKRDLFKTLCLTLLAITIELVLYWKLG